MTQLSIPECCPQLKTNAEIQMIYHCILCLPYHYICICLCYILIHRQAHVVMRLKGPFNGWRFITIDSRNDTEFFSNYSGEPSQCGKTSVFGRISPKILQHFEIVVIASVLTYIYATLTGYFSLAVYLAMYISGQAACIDLSDSFCQLQLQKLQAKSYINYLGNTIIKVIFSLI